MINDDIEEEKIGFIGTKYTIYEKIGSGGTSKVFKVKPKEKNIDGYYAAKVYKNFENKENDDFEAEKTILSHLKNKSPYILNLIDSGEDEIRRNDRETSKNNYIIVDYMKNGCLFDYIYYSESGLKEDLCKILIYKICKAIQICHNSKICIRDIKLENILLDDKYNPILCDFGFGKMTEDNVTGELGTRIYMAPEVLLNESYSGFKVDIFNLAIIIYILMTRKPLVTSKEYQAIDNRVKLLYDKKYAQFWDKLGDEKNKFSKELKKLFENMTLKEPSERITINEVLKDDWLKDLNDEKIKELEKELKDEFDKIKDKVINGLNTQKEKEKYQISSSLDDRGSDSDEECECEQIFRSDLKIKSINKDLIRENYVEIKDKSSGFDPYYFMDKYYDEINNEYQCETKEQKNQKSLKFNAILHEKITINNGKDKNNIFEQELNIEIKMYKTSNSSYLIRFRKKCGELYDFYENVKKIISAIDEII